jgi:hypothetical protein
LGIYFVENTFNELQINPFCKNDRYDNSWIMFKLLDSASFKQYTGRGEGGIFQLIITKKNIDWEYRIFDFIQYETVHENNIIIAIDKADFDTAKEKYGEHSYKDNFLRFYEKKILMHTTSKEHFASIMSEGCLKSWNLLRRENAISEGQPIGTLLGDPKDYNDYIMFNNGGASAELVVSSRQKGYIDMDLDKPYIAGARLYFDCERIAEDGLLVRDGAHLKVKEFLPIEEYLLWVATPDKLGITAETTPRIFAERADKMFQEKFDIIL